MKEFDLVAYVMKSNKKIGVSSKLGSNGALVAVAGHLNKSL